MRVLIGVDPQPSLIAYHVGIIDENGNLKHMIWDMLFLRKKASFRKPYLWQNYLISVTQKLFKYDIVMATRRKLDFNGHIEFNFAIESQRCRINSIVEQTMLSAAHNASISPLDVITVVTIHPRSWKSKLGIQCQGSNYANKELIKRKYGPILEEYNEITKSGTYDNKALRIHDLLDAYCINLAQVLIFFNSDNK